MEMLDGVLILDESQQPTCPQARQIRRWNHVSPSFKHSSHPSALGLTFRIVPRCKQLSDITGRFPQLSPAFHRSVSDVQSPHHPERETSDPAASPSHACAPRTFEQNSTAICEVLSLWYHRIIGTNVLPRSKTRAPITDNQLSLVVSPRRLCVRTGSVCVLDPHSVRQPDDWQSAMR